MTVISYLSLLAKQIGMDKFVLKKAIQEGSGGSGGDSYTKPETDALLDLKADITITDSLQTDITDIQQNIDTLNTEIEDKADITTTDNLQTQIDTLNSLNPILTINNLPPDTEGNYNIASSGDTGETIPLSSTDTTTITEAITDINNKFDNYYLQTETYSSTQIDDLLLTKADVTDLDLKANSSDVYLKIETYSNTQIDDMLSVKSDIAITDGLQEDLDTLSIEVDTKANVTDVYDKPTIDSKLLLKADKTTTDNLQTQIATNTSNIIKGYFLTSVSVATATSYPTSITLIGLGTPTYNDSTVFTYTAPNTLTILKQGIYQCIYRVQVRGTLLTSGRTYTYFNKNGTSVYRCAVLTPSTLLGSNFSEFVFIGEISLNANDTLTLSRNTSASTLQYGDNEGTLAYSVSVKKVA